MAPNGNTPYLLGLPTELIVMIGNCCATTRDLGQLRLTHTSIAGFLQHLIGPRISVPVTIDAQGVENLETLLTSASARAPPIAKYVKRIRLADLGISTRVNSFCRDANMTVEELGLIHINGPIRKRDRAWNISYEGYARPDHGNQVKMREIPKTSHLVIDQKRAERIAHALEQYPSLCAIRTFFQRTEYDLLYNSTKPWKVPILSIAKTSRWKTAVSQTKKPLRKLDREHRLITTAENYDYDSIFHVYEELGQSFVRPAYFDLIRIDENLRSDFQVAKLLQRLSITSPDARSRDRGCIFPGEGVETFVTFLRRCDMLQRLRVQFAEDALGDGLHIGDLADVLGGGDLPQLTHLRIDGGTWYIEEFGELIHCRISALKFFYLDLFSFICDVAERQVLNSVLDAIRESESLSRVYIDFGELGFEQMVDGRGFEKLEERMEWRWTEVDPETLQFGHTDYMNVGPRPRIGRLWSNGNLSLEEPQTMDECQKEYEECFENVKFD